MSVMRHLVHRHRRKILATHSVIIVTLLASGAVTFNAGKTTLYLDTHGTSLIEPGKTADIDIGIDTSVPVNAMSATITFPPDLLEVVSISKERSFIDLWTEETTINEESGTVHWSGGTLRKGGLMGTSTALSLRVRAKKPGTAEIAFKDAQILASDGRGTSVETVAKPFSYSISYPAQPAGGSNPPQGAGLASSLSYDLNGDERVNIVDISIFMLRMAAGYDARYDYNGDGKLGLPDLSALFAHLR